MKKLTRKGRFDRYSSWCLIVLVLLVLPVTLKAEQTEPPAVACPEGSRPTVGWGKHIECAIDQPTDIDRFNLPVSQDDVGKLAYVTLVQQGGDLYPCMGIYTPSNEVIWGECGYVIYGGFFTIPEETGNYRIEVSDDDFSHAGSYLIQPERYPPLSAARLVSDQPQSDTVNHPGDQDFFSFDVLDNGHVELVVTQTSGDLYQCAGIYDSTGASTGHGDCGYVVYLDATGLAAGKYTVSVMDDDFSHTGTYDIEMHCVEGCPPVYTPASVVNARYEASSGVGNTLLLLLPLGAVAFLRPLLWKKHA